MLSLWPHLNMNLILQGKDGVHWMGREMVWSQPARTYSIATFVVCVANFCIRLWFRTNFKMTYSGFGWFKFFSLYHSLLLGMWYCYRNKSPLCSGWSIVMFWCPSIYASMREWKNENASSLFPSWIIFALLHCGTCVAIYCNKYERHNYKN